jgi:hypothetical protein
VVPSIKTINFIFSKLNIDWWFHQQLIVSNVYEP